LTFQPHPQFETDKSGKSTPCDRNAISMSY
jgi:hypothetical protein